jgi:CrcB protein
VITILLSLAGGVGAITRYVVDSLVRTRWQRDFPLGTLIINVTGSFILGILAGLVIAHGASDHVKAIAGTGFCGGYTTFSAASVESIRLAQRREWVSFFGYTAVSMVVALLATGAGLWMTGAT